MARRYATVVVIDSFDHHAYADPPLPFHTADAPGTRTRLWANYAATRPRHQDRRAGTTLAMRPYTSPHTERYQHLLLGTRPLVNDTFAGASPIQHAGYLRRRQEAIGRLADWEFDDDRVLHAAPIEVLHCRTDLLLNRNRLVVNTLGFNHDERRYALGIGLTAARPLYYTGARGGRRRYLCVAARVALGVSRPASASRPAPLASARLSSLGFSRPAPLASAPLSSLVVQVPSARGTRRRSPAAVSAHRRPLIFARDVVHRPRRAPRRQGGDWVHVSRLFTQRKDGGRRVSRGRGARVQAHCVLQPVSRSRAHRVAHVRNVTLATFTVGASTTSLRSRAYR